jgi:hypothetical protein
MLWSICKLNRPGVLSPKTLRSKNVILKAAIASFLGKRCGVDVA